MTEPRTGAGKPAAIRAMRVLLDEYEHIVAASVPAENAGMAERVLDRMHDDLPLHAHALAEYLTLREDEARAEADKGLAMAAAEAALPEGWAIWEGHPWRDRDYDGHPVWRVAAGLPGRHASVGANGPSPAAALERLRAALEAIPALPREAPDLA